MKIIKSHGAPTVLTVGEVNQKYIDLYRFEFRC